MVESEDEDTNESKAEVQTAPKPEERTDQNSESKLEAAVGNKSKAEGESKQDETLRQESGPIWYDRAISFLEVKGRPVSWLATIAVPIVLAFYAYKADKLAEKQHEQIVKQTEIQDKQRDIGERQAKIQEAQNELTRLQYEPTFVLRVNTDVDSKNRVVDVYNLSATVSQLDAFLYSSVRVDWVLPREGNRHHVTYFGFVKGTRTYDKLQPQVVAQFKTDLPRELITRLNAEVDRPDNRRIRNQWIPIRIQQTDWVHLTFKTRASDNLRHDDQQLGDQFISSNPIISMGEAARQNFYFDGTVTMQDQTFRFSDFLGGYFKVGDEKRNQEFLLDYMKNAHLACPAINATKTVAQARSDVTNAAERDAPLDEAFFSTIQSPVRCKRADVDVNVDGTIYVWKFAQ